MKILTILGARPQFIKAAAVSRAIQKYTDLGQKEIIKEVIVHTGQHFDANMSDVFFDQLNIPRPNYNLGLSSLSHGAMTGRMIEGIETILMKENPDWVLVYGDTNSTLAGALAAVKLHIPVAHVEAGLRSRNLGMPEEINRVLTDRVSSILLCPTQTAVENLTSEGYPYPLPEKKTQHIQNVGDVMFDVTLHYQARARESVSLEQWGVTDGEYVLCTLHRAENTDDHIRLENIITALRDISRKYPVVLPLHPRTRNLLASMDKQHWLDGLNIQDPVPYLEMQRLEMGAKAILTDSGGIQKEAFFHNVPCITLRDETEWVETVQAGWNQIVGADRAAITAAWAALQIPSDPTESPYGNGNAAEKILQILLQKLATRD